MLLKHPFVLPLTGVSVRWNSHQWNCYWTNQAWILQGIHEVKNLMQFNKAKSTWVRKIPRISTDCYNSWKFQVLLRFCLPVLLQKWTTCGNGQSMSWWLQRILSLSVSQVPEATHGAPAGDPEKFTYLIFSNWTYEHCGFKFPFWLRQHRDFEPSRGNCISEAMCEGKNAVPKTQNGW